MAFSSAGESTRPPWLHEGIGRLQAEQLIASSGRDGAFLLRNSESEKGTHVLSLCYQGDVSHYRVKQSEKGYYLQTWQQHEITYFRSLEDMIHFYKDPDTGLQCPLTNPIIAQEDDDDTDDEYVDPCTCEKDDSIMAIQTKFYQGSVQATKREVPDVDDEFWTWLDTYVNEGIGKDIKSTQLGRQSLPDELQRLMDLASSGLVMKMKEFMKRMAAAHEFFAQCSGFKGGQAHQSLDQTLKEFSSQSFINKLKECSAMISSIDKKAVSTLRQIAIVMAPTTPFPKSDQECLPQQIQRPQPLETFEVQALFAAYLKQKCFLKVNVMEGQLYITKNVDEMPTPYSHSQILQLIKSRSNQLKLSIRIIGKGKKDYQFEDYKQRELFCQLVQQMHVMHNPNQEVEAITVFIGTWNMGDADPPINIDSWFRSAGSGKPLNSSVTSVPHDVYAIGTQESALSEKEWVSRIKNSLSSFPNVTFKQIAVQTLWGMRLVILVKEEHVNRISHVQMSTIKTGIAGVAGNKGGIGIAFHFSGTSFCFINCHLTSGIEKCQRRNNNFRDILRGLQLGQTGRRFGSVDLAHQFHHLFWFGDLNYRVDLTIEKIFKHIEAKSYQSLLKHDQLEVEQKQGKAFFLFKEEEINFPPTYRHQRGTRGIYEYKKFKKTGLRINVPSYCDRVLWSSFPGTNISNSSYGCTDDIMTSDHSPVFATFNVGVVTQYIPACSYTAIV
jgi:phosphatidylinositol-3,4,5-trisphosphate 5-phosphatase 2